MKPLAFCLVLTSMFSCAAAAAVKYEVINLGPGRAQAVNNKGQVAVNSWKEFEGWHYTTAFLWENGQMQELGEGEAYSINGKGQVVGWGADDKACFWQNGTRIDLPYPGYANVAYDINDSGQIVGTTVVSNAESSLFCIRME